MTAKKENGIGIGTIFVNHRFIKITDWTNNKVNESEIGGFITNRLYFPSFLFPFTIVCRLTSFRFCIRIQNPKRKSKDLRKMQACIPIHILMIMPKLYQMHIVVIITLVHRQRLPPVELKIMKYHQLLIKRKYIFLPPN